MTKDAARKFIKRWHPDKRGGRALPGTLARVFDAAVQSLRRQYNRCACGVTIRQEAKSCWRCFLKRRRAGKPQLAL